MLKKKKNDSITNKRGHLHHTHVHTHGAIDPTIFTTQRGIWAIKWSFFGLLVTALFQVVIVLLSGRVALLADTIHSFGDAATAIPLWIAFMLARRKPNKRCNYGYVRVDGLTGREEGERGGLKFVSFLQLIKQLLN